MSNEPTTDPDIDDCDAPDRSPPSGSPILPAAVHERWSAPAGQVGHTTRVGAHLRRWRTERGISQLRLAVDSGVSSRHLSFVETGRAQPSRQLILHLARFLTPSSHEVNVCLLAAGFAPTHTVGLDVGSTALDATLDEMIHRHDPYPAFVFDPDWVMGRLNDGGQWLCSVLMPKVWDTVDAPRDGLDMIAALIHPDGLFSRMRDPEPIGTALLRQLRTEQLTNPGLTERVDALERSLHERFPDRGSGADSAAAEATLRVDFDTGHGPMSFLTFQVVVGIPQHITVATPRVELWFPADALTRAVFNRRVEQGTEAVLASRSA